MEPLELEKEKKTLEQKIEIIKDVLQEEKIDLENLYSDFFGDREELWQIAERKEMHIKNLESSLDKPYFARIDFTPSNDQDSKKIYIGKNGVMKNTDIVVTDWRAPISSLYYDSEVGTCSYEAPEGIINGDMLLKRQFEIEKGILSEYFDVDLVSNDGLLQKYLNSNNDSRLKSIVSTIQKEQNEVIRKKLSDNIIIQGVAGSGKTTVALHRIAYLVYNYIKNVKQNQYLVIGPNPVFLKYIKSVLPELDVDGVAQCTYEEFVKKYIKEDINIISSDKKIVDSISGNIRLDIDKFKCSLKYKNMLEAFLASYIYNITSKPLMLGNFEVLSKEVIENTFNSTAGEYSGSLNNRIELTIDKLCRYIEINKDDLIQRYGNYTYELFKTIKPNEEAKMRLQLSKDREEISRDCRSIIRKYFNKSKLSTTKIYKLFISSVTDFNLYHYENIEALKKEALKNIKNNLYDFEDLAALLYIEMFVDSNKEFGKIRHVVVDEAQDLGEFNFATLKQALPNATFSIFGDLAQSIYDYRGIDNWMDVNNAMFDNTGKIINFNKSYRTTAEIMDTADDVAEMLGLNRSELVVRHGDEVRITEIENDCQIPEYIIEKIQEYKNQGFKTIAIISKTDEESLKINDKLKELNMDIPNVSLNDDLSDERFNVCTISNQMAKGLEFDAVIINNANEEIYNSSNNLDMKLLYVAITRALHELDIVYSKELTKPLENHLKKTNNGILKKELNQTKVHK